jgi:hypothetical protein
MEGLIMTTTKTMESLEQIKQHLTKIKSDMKRGTLSFSDMDWLVSTLEVFVEETNNENS